MASTEDRVAGRESVQPEESEKKFSLLTLSAMVVGSMVGAGIFSLPARFGAATGPFGALVAWAIAGTGMLTLALVFQLLAQRRPDLDAGIFAYAREGFGNYAGFASAFCFWCGTCLGNVTYFVLIKSTLGAFFPVFGDGNTPVAIVVSSVILWAVHFMILRGIREAAGINTVVTIAKILPILAFVLLAALHFDASYFRESFWGGGAYDAGAVMAQVRMTMLVTVFVFIGVEGASVYSRFARRRRDVGIATVGGFVGVLALMVAVTLLSYGILPREELGELRQPSMAGVLAAAVGPWGEKFVSAGLIISVLGAYLAWSLLAAEIVFAAARSETMPAFLARENRHGVPSAALWLTNIVVQVFLILTVFARAAFDLTLDMTSAMTLVPYVLAAGFAVQVTRRPGAGEPVERSRGRDLLWGSVATLYTLFMLSSGGLKHLLLASILFAPGTLLFVRARREQGERLFTPVEAVLCAAVVVAAVVGVYMIASGAIEV